MSDIDKLREELSSLTTALQNATDEAKYDEINSQLAQVNKQISLHNAKERQRLAEEAAAKAKAERDYYNKEVKRLEKAKQEADTMDAGLFDKLRDLYESYCKEWDYREQIVADTEQLKIFAKEKNLPEPEVTPIKICNMQTIKGKRDFFLEICTQYDLAARYLYAAKGRGEKGIPERPGMDWYMKGAGQYYPRPPEPPIPTEPPSIRA